MRTVKVMLSLAACILLAYGANSAHAVTVFDDFDDGVIDASLWIADTGLAHGAALEETGGHIVFTRKGRIQTRDDFPTVEIEGVLEITGSLLDVFSIGTRRNNTPSQGIGFVLGSSDNPDWDRFYGGNAYIVTYNASNQRSELGRISVAAPLNTPIQFKVIDDGHEVRFFVNDLVTPLLTATSDVSLGSQVIFQNREVTATCVSLLDWVRIEPIPPPCPSPCGDEVVTARRPTFSWCPATDATWYQLLALRDGKPLVRQWVNAATTWEPDFDLPAGNYCWWVRPWGPVTGMGSWSTGCCFSVEACAVAAVGGLSPDGDCLAGNPVSLSWDADACASHYQVRVERNDSTWFRRWFETGTTAGTVTLTVPAAVRPGAHRWWVRGWNVDGLGGWSAPAVFEVGRPAPLNPAGGVINPVTLEWEDTCSVHADWYQLWMRKDGHDYWRQWIRKSETTGCGQGTRCYGPLALPAGDYTYWIRAWTPGGMSSWSDEVTFSIQ